MATIENKLFVVGDGDNVNGDYKEPVTTTDYQVANEIPGFPITAADFNTYLRSISLVTCSFIDIIKGSDKKKEGTEEQLTFSNPFSVESPTNPLKPAKGLIKNCLDGYIFNSELKQSNNLKGDETRKIGDIYYIDSIDSEGNVMTKNTHIEDVISNNKSAGFILGKEKQNDTKPLWNNTNNLIVGYSNYIKDHNTGNYKKFSFSIDSTNKILTINFENK